MVAYSEFIESKRIKAVETGIHVDKSDLNQKLFPWQREVVQWALRRGRAALFEECGLGKTLQQLAWAEKVHQFTRKPVVIHTPVGVRFQTMNEAEKFGIVSEVKVVNEPGEVIDGINLVNYEKIHKFDPSIWGGVVLDESSILKGLKRATSQSLIDSYRDTRFRLACTATPAPNDHMELGNHAEFLGVCDSVDMLNRYFYHDSGDTSQWVLMGHARKSFWSWVAQWAICISKPSDIGGDDHGYDLPELNVHRHVVAAELSKPKYGQLFNGDGLSATNIHEEKRLTAPARCQMAVDIASRTDGPVVIWCDTNYEADELTSRIESCVEVRGTMTDVQKESLLSGFQSGKHRVIVTKPEIAGFGSNWQHCRTMIFAGLSYSFEKYYQAVRRCWRFGQTMPVDVHVILADSESAIQSAIARKESDYDVMRIGMSEAMREATLDQFGMREGKSNYADTGRFSLPSFMRSNTNAG